MYREKENAVSVSSVLFRAVGTNDNELSCSDDAAARLV